MTETSGLGQPCRAARVDVKQIVAGGAPRTCARGKGRVRSATAVRIEISLRIARPTADPSFEFEIRVQTRFVPIRRVGFAHDQVPSLRDLEGMREGAATKVRVDQGRHQPGFREPEPDHHELRPVLHEQGNDVARIEPLCNCPSAHLIRGPIQFGVGDALGFKGEGDLVRRAPRNRFDRIRDREFLSGAGADEVR